MVVRFKVNMLLEGAEECVIYPLTQEESECLLQLVSKDFLDIPEDKDTVTLRLDVLLEDTTMISNVIQILSDMFPSSINDFKVGTRTSKDIIEEYIRSKKRLCSSCTNEVTIQLDKIFMLYYVFMEKKDSSNLNRNILRKMKKLGITTVNFIPLIKKIRLTEEQYAKIEQSATNSCKLTGNFFILDAEKIEKEKWTNNNTDYNIYLYREVSDLVQNENSVYYAVIRPKGTVYSPIEQEYTELAINNKNLFSRCQLFSDIGNSTKPVKWKSIVGLLSNLKNVKIKFDNSNILATSYIIEHLPEEQKELGKTLVKFIRANNSCKMKCNEYCPYKDECHHTKYMINTVHIKENQIVKLDKEENYVTVEQARKELREKAENLYNNLLSKKTTMGLLIAQTGLGKTELVIELIMRTIENGKGCIYAIPNRITIKEFVEERLAPKGFTNYIITPVLEDLEDEKIAKEVKYFQNIGTYGRLRKYLHKILEDNKASKNDLEIISAYLEVNEQIKNFDGLIITTHSRFPYFSEEVYKNKIAFIDEDVFDSEFIKITTMPVNRIADIIKDSSVLQELATDKLNQIIEMKENIVQKIHYCRVSGMSKTQIEKDLLDMRKSPVNIFDFLSCTAVKKFYNGNKHKVKCFNFSPMPPIPILITSATAEKEFYQLVFGESGKLEIEEVSKAEYEGNVILWDSHTYSQEFLEKEGNIVHIKELIDMCKALGMNLVTFKGFIKENQSILIEGETTENPKLLDGIECFNFFSILGLDSLKDNDLAVIGKPLKNEDIFYFLALLVYDKKYGDTTILEEQCKTQIVEDNGFLFRLYTYNDEILRKIQMWSISSNEEQYVGRARAISNSERTVYLASAYPVEQLQLKDEEE